MQQPTTSRTDGVRGIVFDLDGTLLHGGKPLPGAVKTLARLRRDRMPLVFCTQDTENTDPAIAARLSRMGFAADPDEIISCGSVLTRHLADHYRDLPVRAIGNERQIKLLADHGVRLVESNEPARAVIIALYSGFSMHDVETACNAVWAGADLVAIALDRSFPTWTAWFRAPEPWCARSSTQHADARGFSASRPSILLCRRSAAWVSPPTRSWL